MATIYLFRHGQASFGSHDYDKFSPLGERQATLLGQYLRDSGDDLQGSYVVRRDPVTGAVTTEQATAALKYHGFVGLTEYDVLTAWHYDEALLGLGGSRDVGGAVLQGISALFQLQDA